MVLEVQVSLACALPMLHNRARNSYHRMNVGRRYRYPVRQRPWRRPHQRAPAQGPTFASQSSRPRLSTPLTLWRHHAALQIRPGVHVRTTQLNFPFQTSSQALQRHGWQKRAFCSADTAHSGKMTKDNVPAVRHGNASSSITPLSWAGLRYPDRVGCFATVRGFGDVTTTGTRM